MDERYRPRRTSISIEVCVQDAQGVRIARDAGADRAELARDLSTGGLTPAFDVVRDALRYAPPGGVRILVREEPGTFELSDTQVDALSRAIRSLVQMLPPNGPEVGFVVGALRGGRINTHAAREWRRAAGHRYLVFHRAFDEVEDREAALAELIDLGYDAVLTTGAGTGSADAAGLRRLTDLAQGRITVIGSGGVRASNAREVIAEGGLTDVHFRVPEAQSAADSVRKLVDLIRTI